MMKKIIILLVLAFNMNAQVTWQVKTNSSQKWYYQDGDEFNNPVIDENMAHSIIITNEKINPSIVIEVGESHVLHKEIGVGYADQSCGSSCTVCH